MNLTHEDWVEELGITDDDDEDGTETKLVITDDEGRVHEITDVDTSFEGNLRTIVVTIERQ